MSTFFILFYKAFEFFFLLISYVGILHLSGKIFCFLLFTVIIVSGMCISVYLSFLNWVCWVRGNFSGEPGLVFILFMCLRCVERRAGTSIFGHFGGVDGGTVRNFYFLLLCSGGYGTIEMVKGLVRAFLCFLQFAVSSLGGWISAVGMFCYVCVGNFVAFFSRFLILQVVD